MSTTGAYEIVEVDFLSRREYGWDLSFFGAGVTARVLLRDARRLLRVFHIYGELFGFVGYSASKTGMRSGITHASMETRGCKLSGQESCNLTNSLLLILHVVVWLTMLDLRRKTSTSLLRM